MTTTDIQKIAPVAPPRDRRADIITLLRAFVRQRPGFEPGNYGDYKSYRSEMAQVTRDRHDAETLLSHLEWQTTGIPEDKLRAAFRAFSGRLTLTDRPDGKLAIDYCTGQYFPTEYRRAVCAVAAQALWDAKADNMPKGETVHNSETGDTFQRINGLRPGDWLRREFRREFGARIQRRYFD